MITDTITAFHMQLWNELFLYHCMHVPPTRLRVMCHSLVSSLPEELRLCFLSGGHLHLCLTLYLPCLEGFPQYLG